MDHKYVGGDIPCVLSQGDNFQQTKMPCFNTHEGFKIGIVRGVKKCSAIGLSFGLKYEWVQIHSIALVNWSQFASDPGWQPRVDLIPKTHPEGGQSVGQGLIHFDTSDGYLHVDLKSEHWTARDEQVMLVVFRDIGMRITSPSDSGAQHDVSKVNHQPAVEAQVD
jgi:hypothetical protein